MPLIRSQHHNDTKMYIVLLYNRRSQEFVLEAQCLICQTFPEGRIEAPKNKDADGGGMWGGCVPLPPHRGEVCGGGSAPSQKFFTFWSQNSEFWCILM